jgi:hypothetical protein
MNGGTPLRADAVKSRSTRSLRVASSIDICYFLARCLCDLGTAAPVPKDPVPKDPVPKDPVPKDPCTRTRAKD